MKYAGWNLEKTLLIASDCPADRPNELVDVYVAVETAATHNLANDVRVVQKPAWNRVGRELPSQVYNIQSHGAVTTFRVAFVTDLPAHGSQRVGILYDNPHAVKPRYETDLGTGDADGVRTFENQYYRVTTHPESGQLNEVSIKLQVLEYTHVKRLTPLGTPQPGVRVKVAGRKNAHPAWCSAAEWLAPETDCVTGPLFYSVVRRGRLAPPGATDSERHPLLEVRYKFICGRPWFLISSRLEFTADTPIYGIDHEMLAADPGGFSHYCFRPVTPSLPETDVEEAGHILVAPEYARGLPSGLAFGGFLPYDLAWHGFINCMRKPDFRFDYAWSAIRLAAASDATDGRAPTYRAGTYLYRGENELMCCRSPIYVKRCDRPENAVMIPRGAVYRERYIWHFGLWDEKKQWLQGVDDLGRRLNRKPDISQHPVFLGGHVPPEPFELIPVGDWQAAYTKAGVR